MQRWTSVALGLLLAAAVAVVVVKARAPAAQGPVGSSAASAGSIAPERPERPLDASAGPVARADGGSREERTGFETFADGGIVPELPASAPKTVRFGVILFGYQGAQLAAADAPSKHKALERARAVLPEARKSFDEAVKKGDRGSTADAGRIPRGVLEPALEYVLFMLDKNAISDEPIDTPRGYWIIKRNE